jgi:hypothetical protein
MLEFINFEILDKTKTFATDILLKFEDKDIDKEKLLFIKDRLDNYNLYIDTKYSMTYETKYDESKKLLSMLITITVPDYLIQKDPAKLKQFVMILVENFQQFHERTIQFFINKKELIEINK